jgi:hypothetical protein
MENKAPSWQSTVIALALIGLIGAIFIVVFEKEGVSAALKVWAAIGTLVGVLTGAIPTYFFGRASATTAQQESERARQDAETALKKREEAEAQARVVLGLADKATVAEAQQLRPDLFT